MMIRIKRIHERVRKVSGVPHDDGLNITLNVTASSLSGLPACRLPQILQSVRWLTSGLTLHRALVLEPPLRCSQPVRLLLPLEIPRLLQELQRWQGPWPQERLL